MAGEAKAGDVGGGADSDGQRQLRRRAIGDQHALQCSGNIPPVRQGLHVGGKQGATAQRLAENQLVSRYQPPFRQQATVRGHGFTLYRKAQGQLRPLQTVPAQQAAIGGGEFVQSTRQQLLQLPLLQRRAGKGQGQGGQGREGAGAAGIQVGQGVQGGQAPHQQGSSTRPRRMSRLCSCRPLAGRGMATASSASAGQCSG